MVEALSITHLNFAFPGGIRALNDINLCIKREERVALLGPNGAGKSTLLLHLNGTLRSNGAVRVLSWPVNESNLKEIRRSVGLVFQDPDDQLFSATVFDDVAFGPLNLGWPEAKTREAVSRALEQVGMAGFGERAPHHLSLGEKKRVAIATVLAMAPEIIVLDEPSSNLDPAGKWQLVNLLRSLSVTMIIATHDLDVAKALCSRAIIIDKGRIVADGASKLILTNQELLTAHGLVAGGSFIPA